MQQKKRAVIFNRCASKTFKYAIPDYAVRGTNLCPLRPQVANTRPSTLFYPVQHLVSTQWQHRALA